MAPKTGKKSRGIDDRPDISALPEGRVSRSPEYNGLSFPGMVGELNSTYRVVSPKFIKSIIPLIRALAYMNPDVSQALENVVTLANSGHKIYFDRNVPTEQADLMRNHLENRRKDWAPGQAGVDGLVNKLFSQVMVTGALSGEWVPNNDLTGLEACMLLDPEHVEFKLNERQTKYEPYQRLINGVTNNKDMGLIKLNPSTYRYYALTGDGESPYAIPPYLPVIPNVQTQNRMNKNINFIVDTMGLIGFLEVLIEKPTSWGKAMTEAQLQTKLNNTLVEAKKRVLGGLKDGVVVGYNGDHTFNFNSAARNFEGVTSLFQENELQLATATKQDASLWGRGYSTSETQISVVFMKLVSQLKNVQNLVKTFLEFGYALELRLAGHTFDWLKVQFKASTLTDELKYQQAQEYKIKNVKEKYVLGLIDQDQMADELDYETSAEAEPRVPIELLAGGKPIETNTDGSPAANPRSAQKKKSQSKSTKKSKPAKS